MIKNNVQIEAWAPFGEGRNDMFNNPVLKKIADKVCEEYSVPVADLFSNCILVFYQYS